MFAARGRTYLRVPPVLPCDQPDQRSARVSCVPPVLSQLQHALHRLGRELDLQAVLVRLDRFIRVVQALRQLAKDLPLLGALLVEELLLPVLCHFGAPDGVNAQVFVKNHEQIVEPAFAKALVLELCVVWLRGAVVVGRVRVLAAGLDDLSRNRVAGLL